MRILAITNLYPNPYQPVRATFNREQFKAIAARCPMHIVSPIAWTDEWRATKDAARKLDATRRVKCDDITVDHPRYLFPPKLLRTWYGRFFQHSVARAFRQAVSEFRPDVVLGSWAYPDGWAAVRLAHKAGLPVVVKVHGSDLLLLSKSKRGRLTAEALKQADGVIAVSCDLVSKVTAMGVASDRVRLVYNGIDAGVFHPGSRLEARRQLNVPEDRRVMLFVGNLAPVKGIELLIDACRMLKSSRQDFVCYIIGAGPLRSALQIQIQDSGLDEQLKMLGQRAHGELPDWFRAADLFVLPSYSEGVPNVLLEACACGTRFVATRVGGIPEVADRGVGQLVESGNSRSLASAIRQQLDCPATADPLPGALRSHDDAASEIVDFLGGIVRRSRSSSAIDQQNLVGITSQVTA
jgi:glycosyltransferase involved in cell wall biosynthesis